MGVQQNAYSAAASTVLDTTLNALADAAAATTAAIDNGSALDLYDDLELYVPGFASTPAASKTIDVYILVPIDGINYSDADNLGHYAGSFLTRNVAGNQRMVLRDVRLPPGLFKYEIVNHAGVAFAATLNTLKRRPH